MPSSPYEIRALKYTPGSIFDAKLQTGTVTEHLAGRMADLREMFILCAALPEISV
jgi:hypothetical protein